MLKPTQDKEALDKVAREILANNWDGSCEQAREEWDKNSWEIDKKPYLADAQDYLQILENLGYHKKEVSNERD